MHIYDVRADFQGSFTTRRTSDRYIVVHHAAALYPQATGIEDCRAVKRHHVGTQKWPGIGYHEGIAEEVQGGQLSAYIFSAPTLQRAHILDRNHECYGISALTNFDSHPNQLPGEKWIAALAERVAAAKRRMPNAQIVGHKDIAVARGQTACPGSKWHLWKPDLLARVDALLLGSEVDRQVIGVAPSITLTQFQSVIHDHGQTIPPFEAERIYAMCSWLEVDPAFLLALWKAESGSPFGSSELQLQTHMPINKKTYLWPERSSVEYKGEQWEAWSTTQLGLMASLLHIKEVHGDKDRDSVREIIPVHAPKTDSNDPQRIGDAILEDMAYMRRRLPR